MNKTIGGKQMSDDMENFSNELDSIIDNLSKLEFSKKEEALHQLLESSARLTSLSNQLLGQIKNN